MKIKMTTMSLFLVLSKAFDTIDHTTLLKKLNFYSIQRIDLGWFRNNLTDRTQFLAYKGIHSIQREVTCDIPQGSVLNPLLCITYTDDLPNALLYSKCILFTDNTTRYHTLNNLQTLRENVEHDPLS